MTLDKEIFVDKNSDPFKELNKFLDDNEGNILLILMSNETNIYISECDLPEVDVHWHNKEEARFTLKYKGIRVIVDPYQGSTIRFVKRDEKVKFNIPCLCGYYPDEEHGSRLR